MRFPSLTKIVRIYAQAVIRRRSEEILVARSALQRAAAQNKRVEGCLTDQVLEHLAALERGDKEAARKTFVVLASSVYVEGANGLEFMEGQGPEGLEL